MKVVVDVPESKYEYLRKIARAGDEPLGYLERVIMLGKPLPKGHSFQVTKDGEIIDESDDMGEVSDGYHTFNQLYHQRAVLFATIVNNFKHRSWKSLKHEDGKYCFDSDGEWFIVGIDTPKGSYTYHYETDKYWNMFDCKVLERGKPWDGHTEEDVTRLLYLEYENNLKETILDKMKEEIEQLSYTTESNYNKHINKIDVLSSLLVNMNMKDEG